VLLVLFERDHIGEPLNSNRLHVFKCRPSGYVPATLVKMLLGEGAARSGLQVPLEGNGSLLVGELDRDVKLPRSVARGMGTPACVVVGEARPQDRLVFVSNFFGELQRMATPTAKR
jgi:hypothetical protein